MEKKNQAGDMDLVAPGSNREPKKIKKKSAQTKVKRFCSRIKGTNGKTRGSKR